jgi:hypothetical protein
MDRYIIARLGVYVNNPGTELSHVPGPARAVFVETCGIDRKLWNYQYNAIEITPGTRGKTGVKTQITVDIWNTL